MTIRLDRYAVKERIGEGGFANVYRAIQTGLGRQVALKTLHPELASKPQYAENFTAQAKLAARLEHPNIVRIYDVGCQRGTYYIAMQYVKGASLDETLLKRGALAPSEVANFGRQIADALDYAHTNDTIHADLNPGNVIVRPDSSVFVTDFRGSGRSFAGERVVGVPEYVSPEQARGDDPAPASDLYSLGVIMYHMICGRPPFSEPDPTDTLYHHISTVVPPIKSPVHKVPDRLAALVLRLLAKNPDDRPSAAEVRDELTAAASGTKPRRSRDRKPAREPISWGRKFAAAMTVPLFLACWVVGLQIYRTVRAERDIDAFAASQASTLAREQAAIEKTRRIESEYKKEFSGGQAFYSEKKFGLAEEAFKRASHLKPKSTDPRMFLAAIYIERDQYDKAQWHLKRILELDPHKKQARDALDFVESRLRAPTVELTGR